MLAEHLAQADALTSLIRGERALSGPRDEVVLAAMACAEKLMFSGNSHRAATLLEELPETLQIGRAPV